MFEALNLKKQNANLVQQVIVSVKETQYEENKEKHKQKVKMANKFIKSVYVFLADEVHHASSDTWFKLLMKTENAVYRFGLSGTVDKTDMIKNVKYAIFDIINDDQPFLKRLSELSDFFHNKTMNSIYTF